MRFYRAANGNFYRTKADAEALKIGYEAIDVDTSQAGLVSFFNGLVDEGRAGSVELAAEAVCAAHDIMLEGAGDPDTTEIAEADEEFFKRAKLVVPTTEDAIMDADGAAFGRILQATLERLGELRAGGWNAMTDYVGKDATARAAMERGLGYLAFEGNKS